MSSVVKVVKDVVDGIVDIVEFVGGTLVQATQDSWNILTMPVLEEVFSWFGIVDEYVLTAKKISVKMFDDDIDKYHAALVRTVLANNKNDATFFQNYMYEVNRNKAQIRAQYMQIRNGRHTHGLPNMTISGGSVDNDAINEAIDTEFGTTNTIIDVNSYIPSDYQYFRNALQSAPELYKPHSNTLIKANQYGQFFDDWSFTSAVFNEVSSEYDITVTRTAELAIFWLEGSTKVVEGDSAEYTVKCNRTVPVGKTITVTLGYSGSAVDATDYTSLATVDIVAGTSETTFSIPTIENVLVDSSRELIVSISSIDNSSQAFEAISISGFEDSVTTSITDDDAVILTMDNVTVSESASSVTIPVRLETATSAFTVDFDLSNITALKGTDYENITGTLSFDGTAGEVKNIVIGITADVVDDDYEQFLVFLENCSDPAVDITQTSVVTIVDGTDDLYPQSTISDVVVFPKPNYTKEKTLMVEYHNSLDSPSEWYFWFYRYSDGTHPELDETADRISQLELLPALMIRHDKVNVNSDKTSEEYKSTKRLMKLMNIPLDGLMDAITSNPDMASVDDAFLYFGISPLDPNPVISKMLYVMWEQIIGEYGIQSNTSKYTASYELEGLIKNSIVWTYHQFTEFTVASSPSDVGEYSHTAVGGNLTIEYRMNATTTRRIVVKNLSSISFVSAVIDGVTYDKAVPNVMADEDFTIPVSWFILDKLTPKECLQVFSDMTRLEFYAANREEIAWYKTSGFKVVLRIIQVVVTIFLWWTGSGAWYELLYELIVQYAISEFIALGIDALLKLTGSEEIAIAAGIIAAIFVAGDGSFSIDFTSPLKLLELSTLFANNIGRVYSNLAAQQVDKLESLEDEYESRQEDIDKANESLQNSVSAEYIAYLNSVDTNIEIAITAQYNFSYMYNYDSLIENFCANKLKVGVI